MSDTLTLSITPPLTISKAIAASPLGSPKIGLVTAEGLTSHLDMLIRLKPPWVSVPHLMALQWLLITQLVTTTSSHCAIQGAFQR